MNGLNQILKIGWIIVNSDSSTADHRLRALGLINDLYEYQMELTTNGVIVTDAIRCSVKDGPFEHCRKETIAEYQGG
jgi:hypothetical protein